MSAYLEGQYIYKVPGSYKTIDGPLRANFSNMNVSTSIGVSLDIVNNELVPSIVVKNLDLFISTRPPNFELKIKYD